MVRAVHEPRVMGVRPRILVADDDAALLDDVASVLESVGEVTRAASGAELIEHLGEDGPYDLIVTDIAMPWMTGVQAVQATRYAGLVTPVVVMTALRDPEVADRVAALGGQVVLLHKPFGIAELGAAISDVWPSLGSMVASA